MGECTFTSLRVVLQYGTTKPKKRNFIVIFYYLLSFQALGFHALFLVVEMGLGFFFLLVCYLYTRRIPRIVLEQQQRAAAAVAASASALRSASPQSSESKSVSPDAPRMRIAANGGRRKSLEVNGGPAGLSRNQRRRLQKRLMHKAVTTARLEELSPYHTYHPGQEKERRLEKGRRRLRRSSSADREVVAKQHSEDSTDSLSEADIPSRFRVKKLDEKEQQLQQQQQQQSRRNNQQQQWPLMCNGFVGNGWTPIETANMFGALNSSVHDDEATPSKICSSTPYNGISRVPLPPPPPPPGLLRVPPVAGGSAAAVSGAPAASAAHAASTSRPSSRPRGGGGGGARRRLKLNPRSKSTSPQRKSRQSTTAKQKSIMYRNFDPGKAEWMRRQQ